MNSQNSMIHAVVLGGFSFVFGLLLALTNLLTAGDISLRSQEDRQNSISQVIPSDLYDNNPVEGSVILEDKTVYRGIKAGKITSMAYEISGRGYGGEIKLMLGIDTQGKILGVRILSHQETPGLGDRINEKKTDWIFSFNGKSLGAPPQDKWKVKKDGGDFDQFAGATVTPRAVVSAIRAGLEFFAVHQQRLITTDK